MNKNLRVTRGLYIIIVFEWSKRVQLSNGPVFEWWSESWKKIVSLMVQNVQFSKRPSNHVIRPFENGTKKCPKSQIFGFQVFCNQMVTVP